MLLRAAMSSIAMLANISGIVTKAVWPVLPAAATSLKSYADTHPARHSYLLTWPTNHVVQVDPSNDPRERVHLSSASTSPDHDAFWHGADSDPEEENIEDHAGPHDFRSHRSTGAGPDVRHHGPESDVVLQHFVRMLHEIAPPHDPSDPNAGFQSSASGPPRVSHFHRATIRTSPYTGTTSVMIYSGNPHLLSGDDAHPSLHAGDPFQSYDEHLPQLVAPVRSGGGR